MKNGIRKWISPSDYNRITAWYSNLSSFNRQASNLISESCVVFWYTLRTFQYTTA